jgi:hypothetical protein
MPIFSPEIDNSIFLRPDILALGPGVYDVDTRWAASFETTTNSLTAYWFPCSTAIFCGQDSLPAETSDELGIFHTLEEIQAMQTYGMFGLTLTNLGGGFQLDYFYYPNGAPTGTYGFNLPGAASLQTTGALQDQTWIFDASGRLAVPEPGSWLLMLLGFAAMGLALRRQGTSEARLA